MTFIYVLIILFVLYFIGKNFNDQKISNDLKSLDTDYLKAFIERIGISNFNALDSMSKFPNLKSKIVMNDINAFVSETRNELSKIEPNLWKNQSELSPVKNMLESLLVIANELPKLQQLLEKNKIKLRYSDLVNLLINKYKEISLCKTNQFKEDFYCSLKEGTLVFIKEAKLNLSKDDVTEAFVAFLMVLKKDNQKDFNEIIKIYPNILPELLNRLLQELNVIQNSLFQSEIRELLNKKTNDLEVEVYEKELKRGTKPSFIFPQNLDTLTGVEFENFLEGLFTRIGYVVIKTPITGDQGADLIINKNGEKVAVQAKRYKKPVSNKAIQEVTASIKHYKCDRGIVVTTSNYTNSARKLAASNNVELWDGRKLREVINEF